MNRQIYKMTISDTTDSITFYLLEVPIEMPYVEGTATNTTIDGNVYTDYMWLKRQWKQKWSIMCKPEYDKLEGIWKRQFSDADVPTMKLFYGDYIYADGSKDGNSFQIMNDSETYEGEITGFELQGNASQFTTTGKNLFNKGATPIMTAANTIVSELSTGLRVKATDNAPFRYAQYGLGDMSSFAGKNVVVYAKITPNATNNGRVTLGLCKSDYSDRVNKVLLNATGSLYFTLSADELAERPYMYVYVYGNLDSATSQANDYVDYTDFQIEVSTGTTPTSYEPYTAGPSPNPSYPQTVNIVSGGQEVRLTGLNLLPPTQDFNVDHYGLVFKCTNGRFTANGNASSGSQSPTWATISPYIVKEGDYFHLGNSEGISPRIQIALVFSDGSIANYSPNVAHRIESLSHRIGRAIVGIRFYYNSGYEIEADFEPMILHNISTYTEYEPYQSQSYAIDLGNEELAKIGTYQDYIWNDNGTWKIHKEVGKVVFDGSAGEQWAGELYGGFWRANHTFSDIAPITQNVDFVAFSDYFHVSPNVLSALTIGEGDFCQYRNTTQVYFAAPLSVQTSVEWRTWLGTHNTTVYYALATPTDTEITDAGLVADLNAILDASLYKGLNNVFLIPSAEPDGTMTMHYRLTYEKETIVQDTTSVKLDLTDGGIINACQCRQNVQVTMRETA